MENLTKSKYFSNVDNCQFENTTEFSFIANYETEISLLFNRDEKIISASVHIRDFSTKSTDLNHIDTFEKFKNLFKILSNNEFDIENL